MICVDFLAGMTLEEGNRDALFHSLTPLKLGLPELLNKQSLEDV
jgi:hypothetical protein